MTANSLLIFILGLVFGGDFCARQENLRVRSGGRTASLSVPG